MSDADTPTVPPPLVLRGVNLNDIIEGEGFTDTNHAVSSFAGANSGTFHLYRKAKEREKNRLETLHKEWDEKERKAAFEQRKKEREEEALKKTEKRRKKRQKRKRKR